MLVEYPPPMEASVVAQTVSPPPPVIVRMSLYELAKQQAQNTPSEIDQEVKLLTEEEVQQLAKATQVQYSNRWV